uniref:Uncharacterized protein n=1 Tax=Anguilla anguilla TaxID=7936 RepID=A0A0E9RRY7_ANGAN
MGPVITTGIRIEV